DRRSLRDLRRWRAPPGRLAPAHRHRGGDRGDAARRREPDRHQRQGHLPRAQHRLRGEVPVPRWRRLEAAARAHPETEARVIRPGKRRRGTSTRAGELVRAVLTRYGVEGAVREHRLVTEWESIVGPRVAARAWPDGLRHGVLYVRVTNSAWMHE